MSLFRIEPRLPVTAVKTYQLTQQMRPATCAEAACPEYLNGWRLRVEALSAQDVHVATHCGRKYRKVSVTAGETWLVFEAGQPCFRATQHRARVEREERFIIRGGDHRANPQGDIRETTPAGWVDDFGEHQEVLADRLERG